MRGTCFKQHAVWATVRVRPRRDDAGDTLSGPGAGCKPTGSSASGGSAAERSLVPVCVAVDVCQ